jgi:curli biogenesis system outer membrane secretion channel CsgG
MKRIFVFAVVVALVAAFAMPDAYAVKRERKSKPAEDAAAAAPAGLKKVVAVADFELENVEWGSDVAMNMGDMLVDKLVNTGKFIVVERDRNTNALTLSRLAEREQGAKQAGLSRGSGAEVGKAPAAQALFIGMISGAGKGSSFGGAGGGWGGGGFGLGGLGVNTNKVSVIVRWYDTTSLEIKGSHECTQTQSSLSLFGGGLGAGSGGGGAGAGGGTLRSTLSKTFSKALDKCVNWIVTNMEKLPWEGKVVSAKGGQIYLNAGSDAGINIGDTFTVYRAGEELVDPDSGMSLGVEETLAGQIQISKVMPKFSIGTVTSGNSFSQGDIVRQK